MSHFTRNINALLDAIIDIKNNKSNTDDSIENIVSDLNKITNNGTNIKDQFTNNYYINDIGEDKRCASVSGSLPKGVKANLIKLIGELEEKHSK